VPKKRLQDEARRVRNDLYRQHILESAEQVFAERGFESAKLQEISKLAGLSMGTIYAIFPSKDDLFSALLDERGQEILALARAVVEREQEPRAALHALIETYVGYFAEHPSFLRMHLRLGTSWVLGPPSDSEAQLLLWKEIHDLQAEIFRRGIAAGVFIEERPSLLAKLFSAMDQALLADWVADGMQDQPADLVRRLLAIVERSFYR
jgi:AcrR family transcriptional regulator